MTIVGLHKIFQFTSNFEKYLQNFTVTVFTKNAKKNSFLCKALENDNKASKSILVGHLTYSFKRITSNLCVVWFT